MRILALETSSPRGSVALASAGELVLGASHERENAHGEALPALIERLLSEAGWSRSSLDRIAVGTGPGSFTGLRVGIALAQGIAAGLDVPLLGVCSLAALAAAVPGHFPGIRCPVLDARRGEFFFAAYAPSGEPLRPPTVATSEQLREVAREAGDRVWVGNGCDALPELAPAYRGPDADLPHASWTARCAAAASPDAPARPIYLRPGVTAPARPPNVLVTRRAQAP